MMFPGHSATEGVNNGRIYGGLVAGEGSMRSFKESLGGEPMWPDYMVMRMAASLPNFIRFPLGAVFRLIGEKRKAFLLSNTRAQGWPTHVVYEDYIDAMRKYQKYIRRSLFVCNLYFNHRIVTVW